MIKLRKGQKNEIINMKNNLNNNLIRIFPVVLTVGVALSLTGCASAPQHTYSNNDPWESYNRSITTFNDEVDKILLKPAAQAYKDIVPSPARQGVSNVFANLGDAWSFVNNLLQLNAEGSFNSLVRFSVNTVLGFGGLLDIATEAGIERHKRDFGLTLARWGVPSGPYVVLPLLGPSSVRDGLGLVVDWQGDPTTRTIEHVPTRNARYVLWTLDKRANLLEAEAVLDTMALDKYSFTRDAYLQMRAQRAGQTLPNNEENDDPNAGRLPE